MFSSWTLRFVRLFVCVWVLICSCRGTARAYEETGHFYTVAATLSGLAPAPLPKSALRIVEFCSYVPDESEELNAVTVYYTMANPYHLPLGGLVWGLFRSASWSYDSDQISIRRMVMVQQQLHSLTGTSSNDNTNFAIELVRKLSQNVSSVASDEDVAANKDKLCALGFGLHLLGDSYAHRQLTNPSLMYDTGLGHAFDYVYPDLPMYNHQPDVGEPALPDSKDHTTCQDAAYRPDCKRNDLERDSMWGSCYVNNLVDLFPGPRDLDPEARCQVWKLEGQAVEDKDLAVNSVEPRLRAALCHTYRKELGFGNLQCPDEENDDLLPASDGTQYFGTYVIQETCQDYLDRTWKMWSGAQPAPTTYLGPDTKPSCRNTWDIYHQLLWQDGDLRAQFIHLLPRDLQQNAGRLKCMEDADLWSNSPSCD